MIGIGLYVKNSVAAIELYTKAFGLELGYHVLNDDGSFFHSELMKGEEGALAVVEANRDVRDCPVQLGFTFASREELENAFALLREGGRVSMDICELPWSPCAAEVVDRFGIDWYLTLEQHRPADDFTPADCDYENK